ncbi:MAG: hypothetical protein QNJ70_16445 [Xenococcaceae cyanobacterium MO_207.B15]|nr:hypothetical protein [Xenococcaceae cyanobacterium MO_207.B15]
MNSRTTIQFRKNFSNLPKQIQQQTRQAYRLFKQNPQHPSLRFKKVHSELPVYSARITKNYHAVGILEDNTIIWFWVGTHGDYDKLLSVL